MQTNHQWQITGAMLDLIAILNIDNLKLYCQ